jgi:Endodeoxyribonuclease RusA
MSKARPRAGAGRVYTPAPYRAWKDRARAELSRIWAEQGLARVEGPAAIVIHAHGPGRCDADNLAGALLDAGLPDKRTGWPGAWRDDRVTVFPSLALHWHRSQEEWWEVEIGPAG